MPALIRRVRGCVGSGTLALSVAAALLPTSGCSYIFVKPPPEHPGFHETIDCTTSYAAPAADIILGIAALVSLGVVESSGPSSQKTLVQIFGAPLAGAGVGSSDLGFP